MMNEHFIGRGCFRSSGSHLGILDQAPFLLDMRGRAVPAPDYSRRLRIASAAITSITSVGGSSKVIAELP
jgi:hypothetical protein